MKKILIMGASSGIGLRMAEELAKRGVTVGLAARRTDSLRSLQKKYPGCVHYAEIDITLSDAPHHMLKLINKMGGMDIYFHVAGIGYSNPTLDPETDAQIISTNAAGFARMLSTAYRYFRDNNIKGQIAAVTSVSGTKGIGRMPAYSASKRCAQNYMTALEQLSNTEKADIIFSDIRPGWVRTPLLSNDKKYLMEMTLDYVTPLIIKAIVRKERVAVIDWRWNILVGLWRAIPYALWVHLGCLVK